jgi:hypothetical protein
VHDAERLDRLAALTAGMTMGVGALVLERGGLAVAPWLAIALVAACAVTSLVLQRKRRSWGREGRVVDLWSVPHFLAGATLGALGLGLPEVLAIAVVWEGVELVARVPEAPANRAADVALAALGWACLAQFN